MNDLPDEFAIPLGQLVYLGGAVDMILERCLAPPGHKPPSRRLGLSGTRLVAGLRKVASAGSELEAITDGYERLYEWRNHLIHGSHNYANGCLWTWREPSAAKGEAAFSFQFTLAGLQETAQSWRNLAAAAEAELQRRAG